MFVDEKAMEKFLAAQDVLRSYAPRATLNASAAFINIVLRTNHPLAELPNQIELARIVGVSQSNINQILASLTEEGRLGSEQGYGLLYPKDYRLGRKRGTQYCLTERGKKCVREMRAMLEA